MHNSLLLLMILFLSFILFSAAHAKQNVYLGASVGEHTIEEDNVLFGSDDNDDISFSIGLGTRFNINENVSVRGE